METENYLLKMGAFIKENGKTIKCNLNNNIIFVIYNLYLL